MKLSRTNFLIAITMLLSVSSCSTKSSGNVTDTAAADDGAYTEKVTFNADSAFRYVKTQTDFGPRIHEDAAHGKTAAWLESELKRHGAKVSLQQMRLNAFDGTALDCTNIFGQFNPEAPNRLLLLAHWDTRPWADNDPQESNHTKPVEGANDGASGVGVLLEIARLLGENATDKGVDILFVDAEDRGTTHDEDSWALGAKHFVANPIVEGYNPSKVILLDMVGGKNAKFACEYFSMQADPDLVQKIWSIARSSGYGDYFPMMQGGAITDDHVQFVKAGIPAIDIIEYDENSSSGFYKYWHTVDDTIDNIDPATLKAVGQTLINYIYE